MGKYFDKFPIINYNGVPSKNILTKVSFAKESLEDIYSNFDYVLKDGVSRADFISNANYGAPGYDWLVYLTNGVIDPYHDYYIEDEDFEPYITKKYGSMENAAKKILYYRNDWSSDTGSISSVVYDSIPVELKKYYNAIVSDSNQIFGYKRKQDDWKRSTNRIIELTLSDIAGITLDQIYTQGETAEGTVSNIDSENSIITVQHVTGSFEVDPDILDVKTIVEIIPATEYPFWTSVSALDEEIESNNEKRYVSLIKKTYLPDIERKMSDLLK